jgi:hypothetical protein
VRGALLQALLAAAVAAGPADPACPAPASPPDDAPAPPIRFAEIGEAAGARWLHHTRRFPGPHAEVLEMFTTGGAAAAVADYDGDGDEDLLLTDSDAGRPNHLLRHDRGAGGEPRFVDVAAAAGVAGGNDARSIVSDPLWLDADGDGWRDLLIARFGTPLLYRNLGDGTFADATRGSGLERFANSIAALAFDYDRDGRSDLLLAHYFAAADLLALETPLVLPDNLDDAENGGGVSLYRNVTAAGSREIRFAEVTAAAGLAHHRGWTLDAGHADLDRDGWPDLYLATDYGTDRLFFNQRDGTFRDATREAIGFDTRKGMNVDAGDYDRDGWLDLYVTNITDEYMRECNMLWRNGGDGTFTDLSRETGTCNTLWGWGAKFADFDNDGWEDLFVATGLRSAGPGNYIPVLLEMLLEPGVDLRDVRNWPPIGDMSWSGYQKQKLLRNLGAQSFKEVGAEAGVATDLDGRGVALLDLDDDGRLDFAQTNANQPSLLYHNRSPRAANWLELRLAGTGADRDALGARVEVEAGGERFVREVNGGNGYASQSTTRLHFGLGSAGTVDAVTVHWPSGRRQRLRPPVNRVVVLREGG